MSQLSKSRKKGTSSRGRGEGERDEGKEKTNLLLESIVSVHVVGSDRVEGGLLEHSDVAEEEE